MHVILPRLGAIKTHESTRKLARRLEAGTARILSATVRRDGGRWYVRVHRRSRTAPTRTPAGRTRSVGVDVGISTLAVLSTGELRAQPAPPGPGAAQAAAPPPGRCPGEPARTGGPARPSEPVAARRATGCTRLHARVGNLRRDGLHKLTTGLAHDLRHGRGRRPQRRRDAPQPEAGPAHRRRRVRRDPPATRLQDRAGTAAGCSSPTAGSRPRRPARPAAR